MLYYLFMVYQNISKIMYFLMNRYVIGMMQWSKSMLPIEPDRFSLNAYHVIRI